MTVSDRLFSEMSTSTWFSRPVFSYEIAALNCSFIAQAKPLKFCFTDTYYRSIFSFARWCISFIFGKRLLRFKKIKYNFPVFKHTPLITTIWFITVNIKLIFSRVNKKIIVAKREVIPHVIGMYNRLFPGTAWKVSKYGVISGPYFPVFGLNTGKYGPEITPYLDTFHAAWKLPKLSDICLSSPLDDCFWLLFHSLIKICQIEVTGSYKPTKIHQINIAYFLRQINY